MKLNDMSIMLLCGILMLNIIFTQYLVNQYFYQNYVNVVLLCFLNFLLFPTAIWIYFRYEKRKSNR